MSRLEQRIAEIHQEANTFLVEFAKNFGPGAKCSLLIRNPGVDDSDILVTNDEVHLLIKALLVLKQEEPRRKLDS